MAFLDNSGDIILDAVLTDTGRFRLAKGDGSFNISKFALGDDEINYGLYNRSHASGSAYYDLQILRSPVLEAFTNNASSMKSKLISIQKNNLLFLPVIKLNELYQDSRMHQISKAFVVTVNGDTNSNASGDFLNGFQPGPDQNLIKIDQGLDTNQISPGSTLDDSLMETQYTIQIDNRLGSIVSKFGTPLQASFIDDDQVATYFVTTSEQEFVSEITTEDLNNPQTKQVIQGPRGTRLEFQIRSSEELRQSAYLFNTIGNGTLAIDGIAGDNPSIIDTTVRIQGQKTGASLDIPVRFAKQ